MREIEFRGSRTTWEMCKDMRIAICDDEVIMRDEIVATLGKFQEAGEIHVTEIQEFVDGQALLKWILGGKQGFDIYFLDILMPGIDGFCVAERIRENDEAAVIIFLTIKQEFVYKGYEVKALRYLMKPMDGAKLLSAVQAAVEVIADRRISCFVIKTDESLMRVPYKEILYFKKHGRKVLVYTQEKCYECHGMISTIEQQLMSDFFLRVRAGVIVNVDYILSFDQKKQELILKNGEVISLTRTYRASVLAKLKSTLENHILPVV